MEPGMLVLRFVQAAQQQSQGVCHRQRQQAQSLTYLCIKTKMLTYILYDLDRK